MRMERYETEALKIAMMGGTYGNLEAFKAVLQDADRHRCTFHVFLGDSIGCCGQSAEILDMIQKHCDVFIAGNHDIQAANGEMTCGCGYADPEDERISCEAHALAMGGVTSKHQAWLKTWPEKGILSVRGQKILLCHGSPDQTNEFLYQSTVEASRLNRWLESHEAQIMCCTHTGLHWVKRVKAGLCANVGVVGKPDHDGEQAVHYAVLDMTLCTPSIEIRRVNYDVKKQCEMMESHSIDPVFIDPLRTGIWTSGVSSLPESERSVQRRG